MDKSGRARHTVTGERKRWHADRSLGVHTLADAVTSRRAGAIAAQARDIHAAISMSYERAGR